MGLYNNKNAYLKDYANVFDFFLINVILVESLLYFIENMDDTYHRSKETVKSNRLALTIARFGRLLRPLRLIRAPEMRDTLDSLIKSMPSLCNALLMNLMCLYVYSILGIQLFSGRMSYCSVKQYMSKDDCEAGKAKWKTNPQNFDNIFRAMLTFFDIQTLEDWHQPVFNAVDSQDKKD